MLVPGAVAILFGALLAALVVAFIVRADFRTAVLGSPGEATVFGLISVKGVVIVLLCAMLTAGVLYPLRTLPTTAPANPPAPPHPTKMRLDVNFDPGWWEWSLFIDGAKSELDRIRCVEYTLHPTFPNPVRVVCTRQNGFDLTARGWGTFAVGVKLMLKDGSTQSMSHQLEFR